MTTSVTYVLRIRWAKSIVCIMKLVNIGNHHQSITSLITHLIASHHILKKGGRSLVRSEMYHM